MSDARRPDTERPPGDAERDRHLLAALRHAPDREASAPAALGREIARQARASLQTPQRGPNNTRAVWWAGWLGALKRPFSQPALAGALGTLLLGGFIGLMWRDGLPPEALPGVGRDEAAVAAPPAAAAASMVAAQARPDTVSASVQNDAERSPVMRTAASTPALLDASRAALKPGAAQSSERRGATEHTAPAPATGAAEVAPSQGLPRPAPVTAPVEGRAEPPSARRSTQERLEPPDPLARPLAQLAADAGDNPQLEADRRQLSALQRQAHGLWRPAPPLPEAAGQTVQDGQGRVLGRLLVQGQEVRWHSAEGSWRAQLPAAPLPR